MKLITPLRVGAVVLSISLAAAYVMSQTSGRPPIFAGSKSAGVARPVPSTKPDGPSASAPAATQPPAMFPSTKSAPIFTPPNPPAQPRQPATQPAAPKPNAAPNAPAR